MIDSINGFPKKKKIPSPTENFHEGDLRWVLLGGAKCADKNDVDFVKDSKKCFLLFDLVDIVDIVSVVKIMSKSNQNKTRSHKFDDLNTTKKLPKKSVERAKKTNNITKIG